jgi:hypothetical protein
LDCYNKTTDTGNLVAVVLVDPFNCTPSFNSAGGAKRKQSAKKPNRQSGGSHSPALCIVIKAERGNQRATSKFPIR